MLAIPFAYCATFPHVPAAVMATGAASRPRASFETVRPAERDPDFNLGVFKVVWLLCSRSDAAEILTASALAAMARCIGRRRTSCCGKDVWGR